MVNSQVPELFLRHLAVRYRFGSSPELTEHPGAEYDTKSWQAADVATRAYRYSTPRVPR